MKKVNKVKVALGVILGLMLIPLGAHALPSLQNAQTLMNLGSIRGPNVQLGYQVVANKVQMLKCSYDYAVQGGASTAAINLKAVDGTNCSLPDNAVVIDGIIDVITPLTSAGAATVAIGTGQAANDLKTATAIASYTGLLATVPVGTAASAIKLTAARSPIATVAVDGLTTGKFNVYIQYLLGD